MPVRGREGLGQRQGQGGQYGTREQEAEVRSQEPGLGVGGKGVSMGSWHGMSWKAWVPTGKP